MYERVITCERVKVRPYECGHESAIRVSHEILRFFSLGSLTPSNTRPINFRSRPSCQLLRSGGDPLPSLCSAVFEIPCIWGRELPREYMPEPGGRRPPAPPQSRTLGAERDGAFRVGGEGSLYLRLRTPQRTAAPRGTHAVRRPWTPGGP